MWNTIYRSIGIFFIFLYFFLLSIGQISYSLENDDIIGLLISIIFSIITFIFIILILVSIKFSKYKIYYFGIVVPGGLRKSKSFEKFYHFNDIKGIKIKGINYLYFKIGKQKVGGHYWKTDQRDKFISIFNETKDKYFENRKK
jgi:hypothetical protein